MPFFLPKTDYLLTCVLFYFALLLTVLITVCHNYLPSRINTTGRAKKTAVRLIQLYF